MQMGKSEKTGSQIICFADDIIFYTWQPKDSANKFLELKTEHEKVARYKMVT